MKFAVNRAEPYSFIEFVGVLHAVAMNDPPILVTAPHEINEGCEPGLRERERTSGA
jgi:hypothetical protein